MKKPSLQHLVLHTSSLCLLAACGGGGDGGSSTVLPDAQSITLTGQVVANQAIQGATVCLDLNANQQCDSNEPASAPTGSDGRYSLVTNPANTSADQAAAAPFVALLPTTAVDAASPTSPLASRALVFSAPAGKGAQINPLTTLVQNGIQAGLTPAAAEAAVAVQLGVAATELYDYQSQSAPTIPYPDNARTLAQVVLKALDAGQSLSVVSLSATDVNPPRYASLSYTDANNYSMRRYESVLDGSSGKERVLDLRSGRSNGSATSDAVLFAASYLTPTGWVRCDANGFSNTRGSPSRAAFCAGGQQTAGFYTSTDISGQSMGTVIRQMQAATDGSNTVTLDPALVDNAVFPAGSTLDVRHNLEMGQSLWVNNLNSVNEFLTGSINSSLETFIKARQNANVNLASNGGLIWLGFTGDINHWLAGAFVDESSQVQYYRCTYKANNTFDVCTATAQGSFKIVTQNGVRLIKFSGQPDPVTDINYTVGYGEYVAGSSMVRFRETKPETQYLLTRKNRLNGVAGDALRQALGI